MSRALARIQEQTISTAKTVVRGWNLNLRTQGSSFGDGVKRRGSLRYLTQIPLYSFCGQAGKFPSPSDCHWHSFQCIWDQVFSTCSKLYVRDFVCAALEGLLGSGFPGIIITQKKLWISCWARWLGRAEVACTSACSCGEGGQPIPPEDVAAAGTWPGESWWHSPAQQHMLCLLAPAPCEHSHALPWDISAPADAPQHRLWSLMWQNKFFWLIKMLWLHRLISSVSGHHFKWTIQFTLVVYSAKILNHETTFDLMSD